MNPFEERNFIQPMGSAIMLSGFLGFFLSSFGFRVGNLEVGGEVFCFKLYLVWTVDSGHWTFHASFIGGKDLFSFQPIGGPKVLCFYSF
jgi:hypothetical protein